MKRVIFLLIQVLFLTSCMNRTKYIVDENNDAIASFKFIDDEYRACWKVVAKDSLAAEEEVTNFFNKIGFHSILKKEVDESDFSSSEHFFLYACKNGFSAMDSYTSDNFYFTGWLHKDKWKEDYEYVIQNKEEYEISEKKE